jgi:hypothetical protein
MFPSIIGNYFFEFLLKLNLHRVETNQSNIGIDIQTNKFILSLPLLVQGLDEIVSINLLNGFFASFTNLKE